MTHNERIVIKTLLCIRHVDERTLELRSSKENQTTFTVAVGWSAFTSISAQLNNRIFSIAEQKHSSNLLNIV